MDEATRRLAAVLAAVIADEMQAQAAVHRSPEQMPVLIADRLLDEFDVRQREAG